MTPRPRKASDEDVFAATARVMSRVGPTKLKLSEIAAEAGLTAGALVQRFGSKRGLMLELMSALSGSTDEMFAQLRDANPSPLAALRAYADCFAMMGESPGALAHHLSYLQLDLTDPDFHQHTLAQARATRAAFRALLRDAMAAGELETTADIDALARAVQVTLSGSLMTWAFYRERTAAEFMRDDLDTVLAPWLVTRPEP